MCTSCVIKVLITAMALGLTTTIATSIPTPSPLVHMPSARSLRLPNDTYPLGYLLHISTNIHLGDWQFNGSATIDIEIRRSTNEIVLHAKNLSDIEITLRLLDNDRPDDVGELVDDLTHTYDPQGTFLVIHPRENYQAFEAGQRYRLEILYTGIMGTRPNGLYWMPYEDSNTNETTYVAATQAEPTYARLIFPCYDEPAFKSNYTIKLTHSSSLNAVSNMPVAQIQNQGVNDDLIEHSNLTTTTFQTTPPMSTYLVAFVISNFESISEAHRGVTQSIYSSPTRKSTGRRALNNTILTVAKLEDYFGVSYSLPKLDHVALKKNQGAAMENWGLITFKEDNVLEQHRKDEYKITKERLIANHEISHQWFGNLVSPEWWTYVWMNEGFATYFGYVVTDLIYPNDHVMDIFLRDEAEYAYSDSSLFPARPMTHYVETEPDIMNVFDVISYKRAACVIKMFHHAFHQKTFVSGIRTYLNKFQYSVVNELDLFDSLQSALLKDDRFQQQTWVHMVREIMLSWTHSESLPVVTVIRNYENDTITFRQNPVHSKNELWWIPLNFATVLTPSFEHTHVEYFMPPMSEHTVSFNELHLELGGRDWLIVNKQQTGFYHVIYDMDNLLAIARQLQRNHSVIHLRNRAALFQDLAPLVSNNEIESMDVFFELLKYLEFEDQVMPWTRASSTINFLFQALYDTTSISLFNQFMRRLIASSFQRLLRLLESGESPLEFLSFEDFLHIACRAEIPECLIYTQKLAHDYIFKNSSLEVDYPDYYFAMHDVILCMGLRHQSYEEFEKLLSVLKTTQPDSMLYDDLIYALRCTQNRQHMLHYLTMLVGDNFTYSIMNEKDFMNYVIYLFKTNAASRPVIWHFIDGNYKMLSRSTHFVQLFNEIAEYVPESQRARFAVLHSKIEVYLQSEKITPKVPLIDKDSSHVGKKMKNKEQFVERFEHQIHKWLLNELPQPDNRDYYAASLSVGNGSDRPGGLLRTASKMLKSAFGTNISL
ncbi:aminopeptidase N isoform X1 [Drosophila sulfurigaster albostrigata]|uniref:aminopeptidase N isoform X1 n=2 Tax=Drosophila sulfurigaster albostrigata TaxID=89887 RepID=UPI002D21A7F1|nr:aminopeptidase N isoform X1 [Drosophila sulfurigaster albostrigata]